ncbi:MAG: acyl-ACP--UDP-N-acetylglucosamine O-acyltransferase [Alphaproteobacteria bacterium]|nr:acyl-ACP--UDP-N-acetylglucosamine O-acyltransferase [Alphaproteobacteria bacterium]
MATTIHPTAVVDRKAELGDGVMIGPFCVVGPHVQLGADVQLLSHVVVDGRTSIGPGGRLFAFAAVGLPPQDMKYRGEPSRLTIGANVVVREHATLHPGTADGRMLTEVGDNCLLMAGAHVAHDSQIGNHVILVNQATLGGHVRIDDHAILGGLSAVHQFVRIGKHAMVGGMSGVEQDVIPYGSVMGNRAHLSGLNLVGLKRRGFPRDAIHQLRRVYRLLFAEEGTMQERITDVAQMFPDNPLVADIVEFLRGESLRSFCQPKIERAA